MISSLKFLFSSILSFVYSFNTFDIIVDLVQLEINLTQKTLSNYLRYNYNPEKKEIQLSVFGHQGTYPTIRIICRWVANH